MRKAYDVMTRALATCAPDTSVSHVAAIMRDRDIGNVLIVEDGKLRGIVTDRDLALRALTGEDDPLQTPISRFMSTQVVLGDAAWSLEKVARIMARNQIRRLPIVQDGRLVGIVSLGDVALNEDRNDVVKESLQAISTPTGITALTQSGRSGVLIGFTLAAFATAMIAWLSWNHSGQELRQQIANSEIYHTAQKAVSAALEKVDDVASNKSVLDLRDQLSNSELYHTAQQAVSAAREKVDEAASSQVVRDLRDQVRSNLNDISDQLPTLEYKPPLRKNSWFG